jgi:methionyl-tRNA formyltransferase
VTLHYVDAGIDSGDIVFQEVLDTSWEDTGSSLYERSKRAMVDLFKRNFEKIRQGDLFRKRQDPLNARVHMASEIHEASRIHLDHKYRARDLLNLVRARSNFSEGASWFEEGGERYEVRVDIRRARQ